MLLESSYPLLQTLKDKCPGTFKHSQYLSLISDSVCTALGRDSLPLKISSMYHDIGKIINPKIFSENQVEGDKDPHEILTPIMSAQLITRHVSDSVAILINDDNFPRSIIQIISQHHGNSLCRFFFC
jgi:putative nucleotidyltransferase with HDIG domain